MVRMNQMRLMTRLSIGAVLSLVMMVVIMWEAVTSMREIIYEDREIKTRHLVEVAYGVVEQFQAKEKDGAFTREELQKQALVALKSMRYEKVEYFWVNDLGKPVPKMVMHPTVPALDGKVLDEARFNKATSAREGTTGEIVPLDRKNLFVAFNDVVERAGHGYVTYLWPKPKAGGGVTEELYTKLSYVKKFEPWGWVIGSGIYIDDVDKLFWDHATHSLSLAIGSTFLLLLVSWLVRRSIYQEFGGEPRSAMGVAAKIAEGDLTGEIPLRPDDKGSMLAVLKHMQDSLREILGSLRSNAAQVESNIEQLSAESNKVSLAAQLQATSVGHTRSAVETVSQRVEVVNQFAHDTEESSGQVASQARQGAAVADRVASEMSKIAATVQTSSSEVSRLVESTKDIEKMANVIKEIADQTNLLALNAAIEAARAGEQGRGFAVVADEVRKLAERTTKATQEIGSILQGIHADTERAVAGMNAAAPVIAGGVEQANQAAATLREIELQSQHALERMSQLTQATREQTASIQEIVSNIDEVMTASAQTEEVVSQSMRTASELEAAANSMFELVKRFRIDDSTGGTQVRESRVAKPLLEWSQSLAVGHPDIDQQHQKLIEIANRLSAAMQAGHSRDALGQILNELVDYTVNHFGFEENLMAKHGYQHREAHLAEHRKLVAEVSRFKQQFESGKALPVELMSFIRDWLVKHILKVDKALSRDLAGRR
jgi:methyl-accepting chemotaxis protein